MRITSLSAPVRDWRSGAEPVPRRLAILHGVALDLTPATLFAGARPAPLKPLAARLRAA